MSVLQLLNTVWEMQFKIWHILYYYLGIIVCGWVINKLNEYKLQTKMTASAQLIRLQRDRYIIEIKNSLPEYDLQDPRIKNLLKSDVNQLKELLEKGQTSSVELVKLFSYVSFNYGIKNNWITDSNYHNAIQQAEDFDRRRKQGKINKNKEILGGVPISL